MNFDAIRQDPEVQAARKPRRAQACV